jgi:oxazoline/thiazoline synthase
VAGTLHLAPPYRAAFVVPGEGVLFDAEHQIVAYTGALGEALLPLLDTVPAARLAEALHGHFSVRAVTATLRTWYDDGVICEAPAPPAPPVTGLAAVAGQARGALCFRGFSAVSKAWLRAWVTGAGIAEDASASRGLLLTADPAEVTPAGFSPDGPSWLVVRPLHGRAWRGPVLGGGYSRVCAACLSTRLRANRRVEHFAERRRLRPVLVAPLPVAPAEVLAALFAQAARWLAGADHPADRLAELEASGAVSAWHPVVPLYDCPACRLPGQQAAEGCLISPLTGTIRVLNDEPPVESLLFRAYAGAVRARVPRSLRGLATDDTEPAWGTGLTVSQARTRALAEAAERRALYWRDGERVTRASHRSLGPRALHPDVLQGFSAMQHAAPGSDPRTPPPPFDDDAEIWWMLARADPAGHFFRPTGNGCAAGATLEAACLAGLLELIERDAAAIWWYNRLVRPGVDLAAFEHVLVRALERATRRLGRTLVALDLTHDLGVPVFAALSWRLAPPARPLHGFGCHLDAGTALLHALREMGAKLPITPIEEAPDPDTPRWSDQADPGKDRHLWPDPDRVLGPIPLPDLTQPAGDALASLLGVCARHRLDVFTLDRTRPDTGVPVVRVIVPGLREAERRLGPGRLYEVPVAMGWRAVPTPEHEMHPVSLLP